MIVACEKRLSMERREKGMRNVNKKITAAIVLTVSVKLIDVNITVKENS